eukprot:4017414-Amphidinium_carterae.1
MMRFACQDLLGNGSWGLLVRLAGYRKWASLPARRLLSEPSASKVLDLVFSWALLGLVMQKSGVRAELVVGQYLNLRSNVSA